MQKPESLISFPYLLISTTDDMDGQIVEVTAWASEYNSDIHSVKNESGQAVELADEYHAGIRKEAIRRYNEAIEDNRKTERMYRDWSEMNIRRGK